MEAPASEAIGAPGFQGAAAADEAKPPAAASAAAAQEAPGEDDGPPGSPSQTACPAGVSPPAAAAAAVSQQGKEEQCGVWQGDDAAAVAAWLHRERLHGVYRLLVESLLTPTPKTNAGSRLTSLASRASQLPSVPGVIYDPHHYQFLARYYDSETSRSPTTKRFPLRRWGFHKSFRFACDAVQQAWKAGEFLESEIPPIDETVAREARPACGSPSSLPSSSDLVESYVLLEYPDLVLPVVRGVSRDKKSRRWAVYYKGQRHYFYDKNCGGCRRAYELAVHLRRQQVEEVEISQVYDEQLQQMHQGPPGAPESRGPCPGPCLRALVAYLLCDFSTFLKERGQETLGLEPEVAAAAAAAAAAHAAAARHAAGTSPILDHIARLRQCIVEQRLPSLLLLQLASVKDLLVQTGLWRAIIAHARAEQQQQQKQQQQQQQPALNNSKPDRTAAACAAAAADAAAAEPDTADGAEEKAEMCIDC